MVPVSAKETTTMRKPSRALLSNSPEHCYKLASLYGDFVQKTFIEATTFPTLSSAVIRYCGGWQDFKDIAEDVANHGADAGFGGWTYYSNTVAFTRKNKGAIMEALQAYAQECGVGLLELVQSFRCIGKDYSIDEIGKAVYAGKGDAVTAVYNGLAWYALEAVAREYSDMAE